MDGNFFGYFAWTDGTIFFEPLGNYAMPPSAANRIPDAIITTLHHPSTPLSTYLIALHVHDGTAANILRSGSS